MGVGQTVETKRNYRKFLPLVIFCLAAGLVYLLSVGGSASSDALPTTMTTSGTGTGGAGTGDRHSAHSFGGSGTGGSGNAEAHTNKKEQPHPQMNGMNTGSAAVVYDEYGNVVEEEYVSGGSGSGGAGSDACHDEHSYGGDGQGGSAVAAALPIH